MQKYIYWQDGPISPLIKSLCRRGRAIVTEDKARDRVDSGDSARERNAVIRPREPAVARMGFFNGLLCFWDILKRIPIIGRKPKLSMI